MPGGIVLCFLDLGAYWTCGLSLPGDKGSAADQGLRTFHLGFLRPGILQADAARLLLPTSPHARQEMPNPDFPSCQPVVWQSASFDLESHARMLRRDHVCHVSARVFMRLPVSACVSLSVFISPCLDLAHAMVTDKTRLDLVPRVVP